MGLKAIQNPAAGGADAAGATREGLLAAAAAVFADQGFRAAKVREICRRAGANGAAVNYHFGGKEALYLEVLRRSMHAMLERYPADGGVPATATAEARFRGFVRSALARILAAGNDACFGRIMAREMVEPTPALDALVASEIREVARRLEGIVGELLGAGAGAEEATRRLCMASVMSQVVFYQHCRPVIARLFPGLGFDEAWLDGLAEHVTRFSLAGIREAARRGRLDVAGTRGPGTGGEAKRRARRKA